MKYILLLAVVLIVAYFFKYYASRHDINKADEFKTTVKYHYQRKKFLMTEAENDFFNIITDIMGGQYYVFPQVHLSAVLDYRIKGQNWKAAFRHINQKSVDYIVCDKQFRRPLLGIELDDWSHDSAARKQRDMNVESIFREAGLPLLRLRDVKAISIDEIKAKINSVLKPYENASSDTQPVDIEESVS